MRGGTIVSSLVLGAVALGPGVRAAAAATTTVGPGQTLTLDADLLLADGDVLDAQGTADNPCTIEGQGHSIDTADPWQGQFIIRNCTIHGLGATDQHAIGVHATGAAQVLLEGDTFDASGSVVVGALDTATVDVLDNTVLENSVVDVRMNSDDNSTDAFLFQGFANTVEKHFQGNHVFKSRARFDSVQNWLVGGDNPGEGNVLIGLRGGVYARGSDIRIVGNYMRFAGTTLDDWNEVKPLRLQDGPFVVEHNVIRDGNWLVDVAGDAEIRYNLLGDSHDRPWLLLEVAGGAQKIHHNVFMRNDPLTDVDGVWVLRPEGNAPAEIYNNTFYGGGACWRNTGPAVRVEGSGFLASLRSNAFVGFANHDPDVGIVRGADGEAAMPAPERLGYVDYNLFFNPAAAKDNYALAVTGKRERVDPGFALHDAPVGGAVDSQVTNPGFAAADKIPVVFPYSDDAVKAGTATVCQILAFYRTLFAPAAGSPLAGGGDPADVANNNIGAIGAGESGDRFGLLCGSGDIGTPDLGPATYTCPKLPPVGPGPGGGGHGFVCVCELASASPPGSAALVFAAAVLTLIRRRRRPTRSRIS